jgi:hypothetical protein
MQDALNIPYPPKQLKVFYADLSYTKLSQSIKAQQVPQEKSLADQLREIIKNNDKTFYLKQAQAQ